MITRFKKERIILETDEGTAKDKTQLKRVWESRIKRFFPHYRIVKLYFKRGEGKRFEI